MDSANRDDLSGVMEEESFPVSDTNVLVHAADEHSDIRPPHRRLLNHVRKDLTQRFSP